LDDFNYFTSYPTSFETHDPIGWTICDFRFK
jgi:hypothetical protein